jgi:acyl dehydratase
MTQIRFDDIHGLRSLISAEFGDYGPALEITQARVNSFADVTDDHQWIHEDVARADAGPFGTTIAHGFLMLSLTASLRDGSHLEITGAAMTINYGANRLRFINPVPVGSRVRLRQRLMDVLAKPKGTLLTQEVEIRVEGANQPAMLYEQLTMYAPPAGES